MLMQNPELVALQLRALARQQMAQQSGRYHTIGNHKAQRGIAKKPTRGYKLQMVGHVPLVHTTNGRSKIVQSPLMTLISTKRYDGPQLRQLETIRGCGNPRRVDPEIRAKWKEQEG